MIYAVTDINLHTCSYGH